MAKKLGFAKLSKQEGKVFKLLITEHLSRDIAVIMGLDEKTVGTYKIRVLKKLNVKTIIGMYVYSLNNKEEDFIKQPKKQ